MVLATGSAPEVGQVRPVDQRGEQLGVFAVDLVELGNVRSSGNLDGLVIGAVGVPGPLTKDDRRAGVGHPVGVRRGERLVEPKLFVCRINRLLGCVCGVLQGGDPEVVEWEDLEPAGIEVSTPST